MSILTRLETKVYAAIAGASGGSALGTFLIYLLGVFVFHASATANDGATAIKAVPAPVTGIVIWLLAITGLVTGAWNAPASNNAGNNATGEPMDDSDAGHAELDDDAPATGSLADAS